MYQKNLILSRELLFIVKYSKYSRLISNSKLRHYATQITKQKIKTQGLSLRFSVLNKVN